MINSGHEIGNLFRNIRIPDEHELREPQITPKETDGKHPFTHILNMAVINLWKVAFAFQIQYDDHTRYHGANPHTTEYIPTV